MKKFLLRWLMPLLMLWITTLSAFLPYPKVNAPFLLVKMPTVQATAQTQTPTPGTYACILTDDVFFYATDGKNGLFLLPKSYYVRLVEYREDYCRVEYHSDESAKRLLGFVATDKLTFVDYTPTRPYLHYTFDLHYTIDDAEHLGSDFLTELTVSCVYYGDYLIGSELYCYVLRGEELGYVPKPSTLSYELSEEYADYVASLQPLPEPPPEVETPTTASSNPMQIALLVAICLLVPILAALILKPPRTPNEPEQAQ